MIPTAQPADVMVAQLYERYYQPILRYLERLVADRAVAEDLAQDTFLKAYLHWEQLHSVDGAAAWLFRIARHSAYDAYRHRRRSPSVALSEEQLERISTSGAERAIEERELIRYALSQLSEPSRAALLLHSCAGYSLEQIATSFGWKLGTVKSRLSRARSSFRKHYPQDRQRDASIV